MSGDKSRCDISPAQAELAKTILTQLFPHGADGIGTHPEELVAAEVAAQVASNLFRRAAEVHQGLLVSWQQMCGAALVSAAASQLKESQDVLEPLLRQLGVELIRQDSWRRGAALPGFRPVITYVDNAEMDEILKDKELVRNLKEGLKEEQSEDLTVLDGELKGDDCDRFSR